MKQRLLIHMLFVFAAPALLSMAVAADACTGIPNLEYSTVETQGGLLLTCPAGDGPALASIAATITITVRSMCPEWTEPLPIPGIPAHDIWLWSEGMILCGGSGSSNADGPTNEEGTTTISGAVASGGYAEGLHVIVMGVMLEAMPQLSVVSPDIDGDLAIGLPDLVEFASAFFGTYDPRADMDGNGAINLMDLVLFARHFLHGCD